MSNKEKCIKNCSDRELLECLIEHLACTGNIDLRAWEIFLEEKLSGKNNAGEEYQAEERKKAA